MRKVILFSIIAFSLNLHASSEINIDELSEQVQTYITNTTDSVLQSDKTISVVMPKLSEEAQSLIEKLHDARKTGNTEEAHTLQSKLDAMQGISIQKATVSDDSVIDDGGDTMTTMEVTQTLSGDIQVNTMNDDLINPSMISTPEGILYVAMEDRENTTLYLYRSDDNGDSWRWVWNVVNNGKNPSLAYGEGNIYMAYEEINADDTRDVKVFRVSVADKYDWLYTTIGSNIIMNGADDHIAPRIVSDSEQYPSITYLYVTYSTYAIDYYPVFYSRSTNDSATWTTPENLTGGSENTSLPGNPDIVAHAFSKTYVAFNKPGWNDYTSEWQPEIWVTVGTSGVWSTPVQLTAYRYKAINPRIETVNGTTMVGWQYDRNNDDYDYDIYYHSSINEGSSWTYEGPISNVVGVNEKGFELAHSANKFHALYTNSSSHELMYKSISTVDIGNSSRWTTPVRADSATGAVSGDYPWPGIVVPPNSNEKACFTWSDYRNGTSNYGVYFNRVSTPVSPSIIMYLLN